MMMQNHVCCIRETAALLLLLLVVVLFSSSASFISTAHASPHPPIWPMPFSFTNGTSTRALDAVNWKFLSSPTLHLSDLSYTFQRYADLIFPHPVQSNGGATFPMLGGITISITGQDKVDLQLGFDESYTLDIPSDATTGNTTTVTLDAPTFYGALRGLETFSQMVFFDFDSQSYIINSCPWHIVDKPRFPHRELLVDSSRHFLPLHTLREIIVSLSFAKVNTLHWHLVDDQSFPFDSPSKPDLSRKGAYSPYERYTILELTTLVEFARLHGVRIVVEIDTPGHSRSWCHGYPEICPDPACLGPLNVASEATFDVITAVLKDLTGGARSSGIFPDDFIHLGGDEVHTECWTKSVSISNWLKQRNYTVDQGYEYFVKRVQSIAKSFGRQVIGWEEIWNHFRTDLDKSTIIQQWLPGSTIAKDVTQNGYRVIVSTDQKWYLDQLDVTWQEMYDTEPCDNIAADLCNSLVLGGGGEMWGETTDTSDIMQTIWPRMAAISERLWSSRSVNSADQADERITSYRCLLNRRGVAAAPTKNRHARSGPPSPGGCFTQ